MRFLTSHCNKESSMLLCKIKLLGFPGTRLDIVSREWNIFHPCCNCKCNTKIYRYFTTSTSLLQEYFWCWNCNILYIIYWESLLTTYYLAISIFHYNNYNNIKTCSIKCLNNNKCYITWYTRDLINQSISIIIIIKQWI